MKMQMNKNLSVLFFRNINEFCSVLKQLPSLEEQLRKQTSKKEQQSGKGGGAAGKNGIIDSKNGSSTNKSGGEGEPIMTEELRKVLVALSSNSSPQWVTLEFFGLIVMTPGHAVV